ncbi:phosphonate ABC transporter, permease protein PhnE [Granulicella sp. L60]|uniref:phosphonate ABC transporter, permease protein PhnE n=1 Tax=Granulicella sp. L60 TaxID=1641866 RepID=UPI00131C2CDE|nr:phosphonate ABC transporter, permease protein PhnE [Granulicella sp. L60]
MISILSAPAEESPFQAWQILLARHRSRQVLAFVILTVLLAIASWRCQVRVGTFLLGIRKGLAVLDMFFPPDWSAIPSLLQPMAVTLVLAMIATIMGMALSFPCALAASSNIAPAPLRMLIRSFIALERALPEVIQLLLLIAIFGLGIISGLIALSLSSIGMLAKLLADSIEEIEPKVLNAVAATGATNIQVIRYAVIPQILPALLANGLFRFEFNVRAVIILGAVGVGGIGFEMSAAMRSLNYQRACAATLLTLVLVFLIERLSDRIRGHILSEGLVR